MVASVIVNLDPTNPIKPSNDAPITDITRYLQQIIETIALNANANTQHQLKLATTDAKKSQQNYNRFTSLDTKQKWTEENVPHLTQKLAKLHSRHKDLKYSMKQLHGVMINTEYLDAP